MGKTRFEKHKMVLQGLNIVLLLIFGGPIFCNGHLVNKRVIFIKIQPQIIYSNGKQIALWKGQKWFPKV